MKYVWTELNEDGKVIRIFRNNKSIYEGEGISKCWGFVEIPRYMAVAEIRKQIWRRTNGNCEWCGKIISEQSLHMHEVISRGNGGEISLQNSVGICAECHIGPNGAHGDRAPRFGEKQ